MGVSIYYGRARKDPNSISLPPAVNADGRHVDMISGPIALLNGDSIGTKLYLSKCRSSDVILPGSTFYHTAVTSCNSVKVGFEKDGSATINGADKSATLATGLDISSAGSKSPVAAIGTAALGQAVWEWLGFTSDPGVEYDIVLTLAAATTATGTVSSFLQIAKK